MMPPRKEPSKRPGSKDPAGTPPAGTPKPPSKPPSGSAQLAGKAASKPVSKPGTPPPAPAGKPKMTRSAGAAPMRRSTGGAPSGKGPNIKMIAIGAAIGIVAIIGILFGVLSSKVDPEKLKAELKGKLEEIDKLGPDQVIEKWNKLKELQGNPEYSVANCGALRKQLDSAEEAARGPAGTQQKAENEAKPYIDRYNQVKGSLDQAKANQLMDQVRPLVDDYSQTTYGETLKAIKKELNDWLDSHVAAGSASADIIKLNNDTNRAAAQDDFKRADDLVRDFEKRYPNDITGSVKRMLDEIKESNDRKRAKFVSDTLKAAKEDHDSGKTEDAKTKLRGAMAKTEGLEGYKELEDYLKSLGQ